MFDKCFFSFLKLKDELLAHRFNYRAQLTNTERDKLEQLSNIYRGGCKKA